MKKEGVRVPGALFTFVKACVDLVFPLKCAACRRKIQPDAEIPLCAACTAAIGRNHPPFCRKCGRTVDRKALNRGGVCSGCRRKDTHFDRAYSPFLYEGPVKALVHELKYRGKDRLGLTLGRLMAGFIREYALNFDFIDYIVPIPLHPVKLREREFNQASLLAHAIAAALEKPVVDDALARRRATRTQTDLRHDQRYRNVAGAFIPGKHPVRRGNILLIDDVLTTGATASEAAKTLKDTGAGTVIVLTLAA